MLCYRSKISLKDTAPNHRISDHQYAITGHPQTQYQRKKTGGAQVGAQGRTFCFCRASPPPKCIKSSAIAKQILRPLASVSEQSLLTEIKLEIPNRYV